jgi:hypothetical protein
MMRQLCDTLADMAQHAAANLIHCSRDSETERMAISRSVALDYDSPQPKQACPVVPPVIGSAFKRLNDRYRDEAGKFGKEIAPEFLAQKGGQHLRNPF